MSPKEKYIELKLSGAIDSKKKLKHAFNLSEIDIKNIKNISSYVIEELKIPKEDYEKLDKEIQQIKNRYKTKERSKDNKFGNGLEGLKNFYKWYILTDKKCCYCGVEEIYLEKYFNTNNPQYENARQRGQVLEIERIVTSPQGKNIYSKDNCKLACYICNNAKSDFISPQKFRHIAKGINNFWNENDIKVVFPEDSDIWKK